MTTNQLCAWLLGLGLCLGLTAAPSLAAGSSPLLVGERAVQRLADSDSDGVDDANDLCPGTPVGTVVNAYGCPINLASCDYTTATVTLNSSGGSTGASLNTRYVLASNTGTIVQVQNTPTFTDLSGTATYMALALTYDGAVSNLTAGNSLSTVSASCLDWSDALVFKVCLVPPTTCDYQAGETIVLRATGGSAGAGVKTSYVLTDTSGKLVRLSTTPSFSTAGLLGGSYQAYALTYTDDNSIANLVVDGRSTLSQVTASCLAQSSAYSLTLCGDCLTRCIPISIVRIRR